MSCNLFSLWGCLIVGYQDIVDIDTECYVKLEEWVQTEEIIWDSLLLSYFSCFNGDRLGSFTLHYRL